MQKNKPKWKKWKCDDGDDGDDDDDYPREHIAIDEGSQNIGAPLIANLLWIIESYCYCYCYCFVE